MNRLLRHALKDSEQNVAMEGWWTDPASDGSTAAGSWKLLGAKLKEAFKESTDRIEGRSLNYKEIWDEVKASRKSLEADIDIREAMSYVPLGKLTRHVAIDGKMIRSVSQMVRSIKELNEFGMLRRDYFSAALLFLLEVSEKHKPEVFKELDVASMRKMLNQKHEGVAASKSFIGDWKLVDIAASLKSSIPPTSKILIPKVENEEYEFKSATDTHFKPLNKKECLQLLDLFEQYMKTWIFERKYMMQFVELELELSESPVAPLVNALGKFVGETEDHALKTMKTVSRIVDYSIRRMR